VNSADRKYFDENHNEMIAVLERIALALEVRNSYEEAKAHPQRWISAPVYGDVLPYNPGKTWTTSQHLRVLHSDYDDEEAFE
jgi:hypothetical protein